MQTVSDNTAFYRCWTRLHFIDMSHKIILRRCFSILLFGAGKLCFCYCVSSISCSFKPRLKFKAKTGFVSLNPGRISGGTFLPPKRVELEKNLKKKADKIEITNSSRRNRKHFLHFSLQNIRNMKIRPFMFCINMLLNSIV